MLFAGLFTFQLVLAGSVAACEVGDHEAEHGHTTAADTVPCDHPVSPEHCLTMLPCAAAFLPARHTSPSPSVHVTQSVFTTLVAMPRSVFLPPDPPPPRA